MAIKPSSCGSSLLPRFTIGHCPTLAPPSVSSLRSSAPTPRYLSAALPSYRSWSSSSSVAAREFEWGGSPAERGTPLPTSAKLGLSAYPSTPEPSHHRVTYLNSIGALIGHTHILNPFISISLYTLSRVVNTLAGPLQFT